MVNTANYFEIVKSIELRALSAELKEGYDFVHELTEGHRTWKYYTADPEIKATVNKYFADLSSNLHKAKKNVSKRADKLVKSAATSVLRSQQQKKGKTRASNSVQKERHGKEGAMTVEHIPTDIALVRQYTNLQGKKKSYDQLLSIWRAFEKAAVERKVTKQSPYHAEIKYMKECLTRAVKAAKAKGQIDLVIPADMYVKFKTIAESVEKSAGVSILSEFINICGKVHMQERAKKLQTRIRKILDTDKLQHDRYRDEVKDALKELDSYVGSKQSKIPVNDFYLSGVGEIALYGCKCVKSLSGFSAAQNAVVLKLIQEKVRDFGAAELRRAFRDTVAPGICKIIVRKLLGTGMLTMEMVKNPARTKKHIGLSGVDVGSANPTSSTYDFETELMDHRLKNAGVTQEKIQSSQNNFSGLSGIAGIAPVEESKVRIVSATDLANMKFESIGLTGKYLELIGNPEPGFSMMIYGKPKERKSTLAIDMAKDFTKLGKVSYGAYEEGIGKLLQDKINMNKANVPGLDFFDKLTSDILNYRFAFIDSVADAKLDENSFHALLKANKARGIAIIGIFHATKDGQFRGGQRYAHDVDIIIRVADGKVYAKSRYSPPKEMLLNNLIGVNVNDKTISND